MQSPWPKIVGAALMGAVVGALSAIATNLSSDRPALTWLVLTLALILGIAWGTVEAIRAFRPKKP